MCRIEKQQRDDRSAYGKEGMNPCIASLCLKGGFLYAGFVVLMRKNMTLSEFFDVMKRCQAMKTINYIRPIIHVNSGWVVGVAIYPYQRKKAKEFAIAEISDGSSLLEEVHRYLDNLNC